MSQPLREALRQISAEVRDVDLLDRAIATSRRITLRRNIAVLACGVLAVAAVAVTIVRERHAPQPGDTRPTPTSLPAYREADAPDLTRFDGVTMTIPSWGGGDCKAGTLPFKQGQYYVEGGHAVNVLNYLLSDVDGDGVQDYVVHVICGDAVTYGSQIVAFHKVGTQYTAIGRVIGSQDGIAMMSQMEAKGPGRIAVWVSSEYSDGGQTLVPSQWRVYEWRGGRFEQVEGPVSFPAHTPSIKLSVVATDLTVRSGPAGSYLGNMTITVRNDGDATATVVELRVGVPAQLDPLGEGWAGWYRSDDSDSVTYRTLLTVEPGRSVEFALSFVADAQPAPSGRFANDHSIGWRLLPPYGYDQSEQWGTEFRVVLVS
jgi:hypothetical protein